MKLISLTFTILLLQSSLAFGSVLECQPEDSNYSISFYIKSAENILESEVFLGDLYASVNDDPGDVLHDGIKVYNDSQLLYTLARGESEITGAETLFAAVIDLSKSDDGLFYGIAYLKSNIESQLPSDSEVLDHLKANLNSSDSSGIVSCEIKE